MNKLPTHATKSLFVFLLVFLTHLSFAQTDEVRYTLFNDVEETFKAANAIKANILAPKNYEEAAELYRRPSERYERGRSIDGIRADIARAKSFLNKSIEATAIAQAAFTNSIQAREDAEAAQAETLADADWQKAEKTFAEAARRLEAGSEKRALSGSAEAETLYRAAELNAIKINYLSETRRLIEEAEDNRVDRYAPITLERARSLLKDAEKGLNEDRYDTDRPRSLARQARYEAKHAVYITDLVKALREDELTEEQYILRSELPIYSIASALDLVAEFDQGPAIPTEQIRENIETLREDSYNLDQRNNDIASLETEIRELEAQLGVQSERLAQQEAYRARFAEVEKLFTRDEANVLTQEGDVLIRTVSLSFASGSAQINSQYYPLLRKIQEAIHLFPDAQVIVEGHTDSFGGDEQYLNLSIDRAEAVRQYLLANMASLRDSQIRSIGYGETRPIGNNETSEGRTKNRRIDLVLKQSPAG